MKQMISATVITTAKDEMMIEILMGEDSTVNTIILYIKIMLQVIQYIKCSYSYPQF